MLSRALGRPLSRNAEGEGRAERRPTAFAASIAGPVLIVGVALFVLRRYAFGGRIPGADAAQFWLPTYCFLGKSLAAGHIPGWNPLTFGGMPFAADPQSGWMYGPPMVLFSLLSCARAIRWMIVLQPILGGLGVYAFLRAEGTSRAAATVGGVVLAVAIGGTGLATSLPFAATLAWTALMLAAASRYLRAPRWPGRLAWLGGTALAWGQLAAAHFGVGLAMGTMALVIYVGATLLRRRAAQGIPWRQAALFGGLLPPALLCLNLAFLLPRLAFTPRTSLSLGYGTLSALSLKLGGEASPPFPGYAAGPTWPLNFATVPGIYLGALALSMSLAGLWSRRRRHVAVAFGSFGALCYLLGLKIVASHTPPSIRSNRVVDFYLHNPYWLSFGVLLAVAVLAGVGLDAWMHAGSARTRALMVGPGVLAWVVLPVLFGSPPVRLWLFAAGAAAAALIVALSLRRPALGGVLPVALAAELLVGVAIGRPVLTFEPAPRLLLRSTSSGPAASSYVHTSPLVPLLRSGDGRYLTLGAPDGERWGDWRSLQNNQSLLFGLENIGGYNPVQLEHYWLFVRTVQRAPMKYSYAVFSREQAAVLNLLDVRWVVMSSRQEAGAGNPAARGPGGWDAFPVAGAPPRVSIFTDWTVVPDGPAALRQVAGQGFDPSTRLILGSEPGIPPATSAGGSVAPTGTTRYVPVSDQEARVETDVTRPSVLLVRNVYDPDWHASVDGRPAPLLSADYLVQAIPVPAGRHTVTLQYDDRSIGFGALGSALSLALLGLAMILTRRRPTVADRPAGTPPGDEGQ